MENNDIAHIVEISRKLNQVASPIIACVGLLGNAFIIGTIVRNRKLRSCTNIFILSLAITHLFCVTRQFLHIFSIARGSWLFGLFGCFVDSTAYGVFLITSGIFMVILSLTRLVNDRWPIPFSRKLKSQLPLIISCAGWGLSAAFITPYLIYTKIDPTGAYCVVDWSNARNLYLYTFVMGFVLPVSLVVIIFFIYLLDMFYAAKYMLGCTYEHNNNKRDTRLVVALVLIHIICRVPIYVLYMNNAFPSMSLTESIGFKNYILITVVFEIILMSSVAITPLICLCFSEDLRSPFVKVITCSRSNRFRNEIQLGNLNNTTKNYGENELISYQKPEQEPLFRRESVVTNGTPNIIETPSPPATDEVRLV